MMVMILGGFLILIVVIYKYRHSAWSKVSSSSNWLYRVVSLCVLSAFIAIELFVEWLTLLLLTLNLKVLFFELLVHLSSFLYLKSFALLLLLPVFDLNPLHLISQYLLIRQLLVFIMHLFC